MTSTSRSFSKALGWGLKRKLIVSMLMVGVVPLLLGLSLAFLGGGVFAYLVAFPFAVQFLLEIGKDFMPLITAEKYYGLLLTIMLGLGLMFELPIVLVLLAKVGLVTPGFLMRNFRWAVLVIFVVSAIITPTSDIVNLCIFAVPTIGLYLLGTGAAWLVTRGKQPEA